MNNDDALCEQLAAHLVTTDQAPAIVPQALPCPPLGLLRALHRIVTRTMLSDLAIAARAADAAQQIGERFPDDPLIQAQVHWTQGSAILHVPSYARALAHYDAALEWYRRAGFQAGQDELDPDVRVVNVVRVFCLSELGRFDEARQAAAAAEEWLHDHPNDTAQLVLLLNRSQLAGMLHDYEHMVALADATIELATRLDYPDRVAQAWVNRAYACIYLGRFAEADAALTEATAAAIIAEEPLTHARALVCRAWLLQCQGQLFAALSLLREAQIGMAQAEGEAATILLEEAAISEQLRQLPEAMGAARRAAELYAALSMPLYSANAALRALRVAILQEQAGAAQSLLKLAAEQAALVRSPVLDAEVTLARARIAALPNPAMRATALQRTRRQARREARQALDILAATGRELDIAEGHLDVAALDVALGDADAALRTYKALSASSHLQVRLVAIVGLAGLVEPVTALPALREASAVAVAQQRMLPVEELQARFASELSPQHMQLASCCLALGDISGAFDATCLAKAGPLLDLRASAGSASIEMPDAFAALKAEITRWRREADSHMLEARSAHLLEQPSRVQAHLQRAQAAVEAGAAAEAALTSAVRTVGGRHGQAEAPSCEVVSAALLPGTALLEYARIGDEIICFLLRRDAPPIHRRIGRVQELAALLDRWSIVLHRITAAPAHHDAHRHIKAVLAPLWKLLIAPWMHELGASDSLLIAPCDLLYHVPWAALSAEGQSLSEKCALTLTPCGAMAAAPYNPATSVTGPPRLLGWAGADERRLDHVARELSAIAALLPGAVVSYQATAADLRAAPPPHILHVAAHARTQPSAPLCSALELADGPLLLLEAHRLDLRGTRLVTLSACETSARPDHGDVALALSGAFLCAGAAAVIASLWRVSDEVTADLMIHLYDSMQSGCSIADALSRARHAVRERHPLDWAAFQLWAGAPLH